MAKYKIHMLLIIKRFSPGMRWLRAVGQLAASVFFLFLATTVASGQDADRLTGNAGDVVWQLNLMKSPPNGQLQFSQVVKDAKGQPVLDADTRHVKSEWNSCLSIPAGLLKAGKEYVITVEYEVIDRSGPDNYFYTFVRSDRLGIGADHWQNWHDDPGARGVAKLRIELDRRAHV